MDLRPAYRSAAISANGMFLVAARRTRVTVLLDSDEFTRLERYCVSRRFKKSTPIARLVREHLDAEKIDMQHELPFGGVDNTRAARHRHA